MNKTVTLLKNINSFIEKANDDKELRDLIDKFPEADLLVKAVNNYETIIARLLREQRKDFVKVLKSYLEGGSTGNPLVGAILDLVTEDALEADTFGVKLSKESVKFLTATISELTSLIMNSIDKDIAFNQLSPRTLTWIDEWSDDLGRLMKLKSHDALTEALRETIAEGRPVKELERTLRDLPEFNRNRARATAITEVLTASSVAQHEAYTQSPAVEGKTWLHSGNRGINPRKTHVALSGTTIEVDQDFDVNGFSAQYPRDTNLPAKERVYCHCVLSPSVNSKILELSREDKEAIRSRTMANL